MPELPETDIRVQETYKGLMSRLMFLAGNGLNGQTVLDMQTEIERTRFNFKAEYGYDFPPIGPFILPYSNLILFFRKDLTNTEIRNKLLSLLRDLGRQKIPVLTMELTKAVERLWPSYKPPVEEFRKDPKVRLQ
jgi:hypothetical protein